MALRFEKGKLRPQRRRLKDLPRTATASEPSQSRGPDGRFAPGNKAAVGRVVRESIKRQLGRDTTAPQVEQLYRETLSLFRSHLAELPDDGSRIQSLVSRQARWEVIGARVATRALEVGIETPEGQRLLDTAMKLDARAERLAVTALDLAERAAADTPRGPAVDPILVRAAEIYAEQKLLSPMPTPASPPEDDTTTQEPING